MALIPVHKCAYMGASLSIQQFTYMSFAWLNPRGCGRMKFYYILLFLTRLWEPKTMSNWALAKGSLTLRSNASLGIIEVYMGETRTITKSPSYNMLNSYRLGQWPGRFLGIIVGWDPSVCKSNRLHVDILWFPFIELGYILWFPRKWSVIFLQSWISAGYFSNSTGAFVTHCRFFLIWGLGYCSIHQMLKTKMASDTYINFGNRT